VVITALFITALITANIIAVKPVTIFALLLPAAIIVLPASYSWATCSPRSTATAKRGAKGWISGVCGFMKSEPPERLLYRLRQLQP
jgi:hypothetical protein